MKELKEKFLRCKTVPSLSKVDDINVVTGVLKDFLRNLKEPLLTFSLNRPFLEAAGLSVYSGWLLKPQSGSNLVFSLHSDAYFWFPIQVVLLVFLCSLAFVAFQRLLMMTTAKLRCTK